eukprot:TRINITY_DN999_c0_g1_i2.p2 TRINITY_DN999_c0_g1~~TRINITY_DN999_c0_g1_i2.p2  ORF type:complete len:153 (+),score=7.97 TRINITY_DN999_c0_g1_i2:1824-2282(+)
MENISGKINVAGAGPPCKSMAESGNNYGGDLLCGCGLCTEFDERFHGFHLVKFLEVSESTFRLRAGARYHKEWPCVGSGVGETGKAMDAAWARDCEKDAWRGSEVAIGAGGVACGLLVVEGEETNALLDRDVGKGCDRDAHHSEHVADSCSR